MAGANVIYGLGMLEAGVTFNLAQLVMDNDLAELVKCALNGIPVNDETLAVDIIHKVGHFEYYMTEDHTLRHMREISAPEFIDRSNYDRWTQAGKPTMYEKAHAKAKDILENYKQPKPLSDNVIAEIRSIVEEAEKELGVHDFWKGMENRQAVGAGVEFCHKG